MANWKKVIVSGSNANLNHITASGNISASGFLFGNLPTGTEDKVIIYDSATGQLKFKVLNLVNAQRAPELFLTDIHDNDKETQVSWRLSFDSGSPTIPTNAPYKFSASLDGGTTFPVTASAWDEHFSSITASAINNQWFIDNVSDVEYYNPATDGLLSTKTASYSEGNAIGPTDVVSGLLVGTSKQDIVLTLQQVNNFTDYTAVPAFTPGPAYVNAAFESPIHGDTGSIQVYLNNTKTPVAEFSLTASGNPAITTEIANIIPDISKSGSALDPTLTADVTKTFRSGSITIESEAQQDGYNFAYTFYTGSRGTTQIRAITNFTHWFYDNEGAGNDLSTVNNESTTTLVFDNVNETSSISGIRFWEAGAGDTLTNKAAINNYYRNIYPTAQGIKYIDITTNTISSIGVTKSGSFVKSESVDNETANSSTESFSIPQLQDVDNAHTSTLNITSSIVVSMPSNVFHIPSDFDDPNSIFPSNTTADIKFRPRFEHLDNHKTNEDRNGTLVTLNDYMVNSLTNASTEDDFENFRTENFRILNTTYGSGNNPSTSTYDWDGKRSLANGESNGYGTSVAQFYSNLVYPTKCGDGGVFDPVYGPTNNQPNYSSVSGERVYLRYFKTTVAQAGGSNLNFEFKGSGNIVGSSYSGGGTSHIFMEVWRSGGGSNSAFQNSFLDVYNTTIWNNSNNSISNYNTQFIELTNSVSSINYNQTNVVGGLSLRKSVVKVGDNNATLGFSSGEFVIVKLKFPQGFTGHIDAMALQYGNDITSRILGTSGYTTY